MGSTGQVGVAADADAEKRPTRSAVPVARRPTAMRRPTRRVAGEMWAVGRVAELLAPVADPRQAVGELVAGVAALVGPPADARDLGDDPLDANVGRLRLRAHPRFDEVPVRVAGERDGAASNFPADVRRDRKCDGVLPSPLQGGWKFAPHLRTVRLIAPLRPRKCAQGARAKYCL